jgi:hypothetical protein
MFRPPFKVLGILFIEIRLENRGYVTVDSDWCWVYCTLIKEIKTLKMLQLLY